MGWGRLRKRPADAEPAGRAPARPTKNAVPEPLLQRLVQKLDELPAKDELRVRQARELLDRQDRGGQQLFDHCQELVTLVNSRASNLRLDLSPESFEGRYLDQNGCLFQINASGRIVQITLLTREQAPCTEHFRLPYILRGTIRWFNQEFLDRQEIAEQPIFYCMDRNEGRWRYMDAKTRRLGVVSSEFLAEILEQLL
jgi:hypothetical protein